MEKSDRDKQVLAIRSVIALAAVVLFLLSLFVGHSPTLAIASLAFAGCAFTSYWWSQTIFIVCAGGLAVFVAAMSILTHNYGVSLVVAALLGVIGAGTYFLRGRTEAPTATVLRRTSAALFVLSFMLILLGAIGLFSPVTASISGEGNVASSAPTGQCGSALIARHIKSDWVNINAPVFRHTCQERRSEQWKVSSVVLLIGLLYLLLLARGVRTKKHLGDSHKVDSNNVSDVADGTTVGDGNTSNSTTDSELYSEVSNHDDQSENTHAEALRLRSIGKSLIPLTFALTALVALGTGAWNTSAVKNADVHNNAFAAWFRTYRQSFTDMNTSRTQLALAQSKADATAAAAACVRMQEIAVQLKPSIQNWPTKYKKDAPKWEAFVTSYEADAHRCETIAKTDPLAASSAFSSSTKSLRNVQPVIRFR